MSIPITRSIYNQSANTNYLDFGNSSDYDAQSSPLTIVIRMCPKVSLPSPIVWGSNGWYGQGGFYFQFYNNEFEIISNSSQALRTNGLAISLNTWFLLIITFDGQTPGHWRVYKNGTECSYAAWNATQLFSRGTAHLILGDNHGYDPNMEYADFQYYKRVIDPSEISNLSLSTPDYPTNIFSWWQLQETTGTNLDDYENNHDGILQGTTTNCYSTDNPAVTYLGPAPNWVATYPKAGNILDLTIQILVETDIDSTAYFICLSDGATAPTSAQVKAGTDALNNPLAANLKGTVSLISGVENNFTASGLTMSTAYDIYVVAESDRMQTNPSLLNITTTSGVKTYGHQYKSFSTKQSIKFSKITKLYECYAQMRGDEIV
jgi:hypothetical protein